MPYVDKTEPCRKACLARANDDGKKTMSSTNEKAPKISIGYLGDELLTFARCVESHTLPEAMIRADGTAAMMTGQTYRNSPVGPHSIGPTTKILKRYKIGSAAHPANAAILRVLSVRLFGNRRQIMNTPQKLATIAVYV